MLRLSALAVTVAMANAILSMEESLAQIDLMVWSGDRCTEADGKWADVLGIGYKQCLYASDYECVEADPAGGDQYRVASTDSIGGCALDGVCMDDTTTSVCDELGGSGVVMGVILGLVLAIAIAIIVYCCCCKGKKTDDNYQQA